MKNGRFLRLHASHPDAAEQRRDLLRRLGAEAEKADRDGTWDVEISSD